MPVEEFEGFVDGGYKGESTLDFLKHFKKTDSYMCYVWEPNEYNHDIIARNLKDATYKLFPYVLWDKEETVHFNAEEEGDISLVSDVGTEIIQANSIDNLLRNEKVTFIKMDIEGAEINALNGAKNVIIEQKPKLAICIYHAYSHLYEFPPMIKELVPEYKIYIRHHSDLHNETEVYASIM